MKNTMISIYAGACILLLSCSNDISEDTSPLKGINPDTIAFEHSMKGWELYSWPNGNDWNFSLMVGTNSLKNYEMVTQQEIKVTGIDSLKMLLDRMPAGEEIAWIGQDWLNRIWNSDYNNLSLPPDDIIEDVTNYSVQQGLILSVNN